MPCEKNHAIWLAKNGKTFFSKLKSGKFFSWHEASRQVSKCISLLIQILFILLDSYFSNVCCTFYLGQMFIRRAIPLDLAMHSLHSMHGYYSFVRGQYLMYTIYGIHQVLPSDKTIIAMHTMQTVHSQI